MVAVITTPLIPSRYISVQVQTQAHITALPDTTSSFRSVDHVDGVDCVMKPQRTSRARSSAISKRRTRFETREQRLPESPPLDDGKSTAQTIMSAVRTRYREALDKLFGGPMRVLNSECNAVFLDAVPAPATCPVRNEKLQQQQQQQHLLVRKSVALSDQVVPAFSDEERENVRGKSGCGETTVCQCGNEIWMTGGVGPEDMLRTAEELSERIMTLYATVVDPVTSTVDYSALLHCQDFKQYMASARKLRYFDPLLLTHEERKAFFLNVYNSLMIHAIAVLSRPTNTYERIQLYNTAAYSIGGRTYSLNMMEHGVLRGNRPGGGPFAQTPFTESDARIQCALPRVDPRIHFALNCGARSCPAVRFYDPKNINSSLDASCRNFLQDVAVDVERGTVTLSKIFHWYRRDFSEHGDDMSTLKWILPYLSEEKRVALTSLIEESEEGGRFLRVEYADYDWTVNDSSV